MVTYAFVYTPLKRYSTLAVAIGAVPGALPVLIGTTAFEGQMTYLEFHYLPFSFYGSSLIFGLLVLIVLRIIKRRALSLFLPTMVKLTDLLVKMRPYIRY